MHTTSTRATDLYGTIGYSSTEPHYSSQTHSKYPINPKRYDYYSPVYTSEISNMNMFYRDKLEGQELNHEHKIQHLNNAYKSDANYYQYWTGRFSNQLSKQSGLIHNLKNEQFAMNEQYRDLEHNHDKVYNEGLEAKYRATTLDDKVYGQNRDILNLEARVLEGHQTIEKMKDNNQ